MWKAGSRDVVKAGWGTGRGARQVNLFTWSMWNKTGAAVLLAQLLSLGLAVTGKGCTSCSADCLADSFAD